MASKNPAKNEVTLIPSGEIRDKKSVHTPALILIFMILMIVGLVNLYTATIGTEYFYLQLKNMIVGLFTFVIFGWIIQARHLNTYAFWIFTITCALLIAVLILGELREGLRDGLLSDLCEVSRANLPKSRQQSLLQGTSI
jgi:hypothetical protein